MANKSDFRKSSPVDGSGRASPADIYPRLRDKDGLNQKDKSVRRWSVAIEKDLSSFGQNVDEWADYVPFLVRLLKSLQAKPFGVKDVPHKKLISRRLAQCLGPALPSGVHQKVLEVYECIFTIIESTGLSRDLSLYLPGLSSLVSYASLSVKPLVLNVYEDYIVNIHPDAVRPALKSLILSLLPALEEENSDEFDRTLRILDKLRSVSKQTENYDEHVDTTENEFFWQCFFLASITSPSRRLGALAYLSRHLPYLGSRIREHSPEDKKTENDLTNTDATSLGVSSEPRLLIQCFSSGLQDEQILVQRGFLDLLCERLPLSSKIFQDQIEPSDRIRLVESAVSVVLRRDMSLNRRLWSWILGSKTLKENDVSIDVPIHDSTQGVAAEILEEDAESKMQYCIKYALPAIIAGLKRQLNEMVNKTVDRIKPLRICIALMDRAEIGHLVGPLIFAPALSSVFEFQSQSQSKAARNEVVRSCNIFFDTMESTTIWTEAIRLLKNGFENPDELLRGQSIRLMSFITNSFDLREDEMQKVHIPSSILYAMLQVNVLFRERSESTALSPKLTVHGLQLILSMLQVVRNENLVSSDLDIILIENLQKDPIYYKLAIEDQYLGTGSSESFLNGGIAGPLILQLACELVAQTFKKRPLVPYKFIESAVMILDLAFKKVSVFEPDVSAIKTELRNLSTKQVDSLSSDFYITSLLAQTSVLEILLSAYTPSRKSKLVDDGFLRETVPILAHHAWDLLGPRTLCHHVEASRALWRLSRICNGNDYVESSIVCHGLQQASGHKKPQQDLEYCHSLFAFWQHSYNQLDVTKNRRSQFIAPQSFWSVNRFHLLVRPLFRALDSLLDRSETSNIVENWLQNTLEMPAILHIVLTYAVNITESLTKSEKLPLRETTAHPNPEEPDIDSCIYAFKLLYHLLQVGRLKFLALIHDAGSEDTGQQLTARLQTTMDTCVRVATSLHCSGKTEHGQGSKLKQLSFSLLEQVFLLLPLQTIDKQGIEAILLKELETSVTQKDRPTQLILVRLIGDFLELRYNDAFRKNVCTYQDHDHDIDRNSSPRKQAQLTAAGSETVVPRRLFNSLITILSTDRNSPVIDAWIHLLQRMLPMYGTAIYSIILPLNECLCTTLSAMLEDMKNNFTGTASKTLNISDNTILQLLDSLERSLELAHGFLTEAVSGNSDPGIGTQATSFFGLGGSSSNSEIKEQPPPNADRMGVLVCFKNALQACFDFWALEETSVPGASDNGTSLASFRYIILRLRNRTRRITGHLFQAQDRECTEKLVSLWHNFMLKNDYLSCNKILGLINTVDDSRPKIIIPALFNAIYSRTHPSALEFARRSSLTTVLSELTLAEFLLVYIRSIEHDTMEEIWQTCITFLKDVLANPLNHRQILVQLLLFIVELGTKIEKTNYGEQRKMKREIGDIFIKTFSAVLTIRPSSAMKDTIKHDQIRSSQSTSATVRYVQLLHHGSGDLVQVLADILPHLPSTLLDHDRVNSIVTQISVQLLGTAFRAKSFPQNIDFPMLTLLQVIGSITEATKSFKKDVGDAFYDTRFFSTDLKYAPAWLSILRQWVIGDKERIPDLCGRLAAPAVAGMMFGVGASGARSEADRRTQLTLRRIALLIVAAPIDAFLVNLSTLGGKLTELLAADQTSSPSSATRAELYMVFRSLLLKVSPNHLSFLWPIICSEISDALLAKIAGGSQDFLIQESLLQLCKLIETLLILNLDEFQLREWLFVTNTTDAMSRPLNSDSVALVDLIAEKLEAESKERLPMIHEVFSPLPNPYRKPILSHQLCASIPKQDYQDLIFVPFFRLLSMIAFERVYEIEKPDLQQCLDELVADIFDDSTLV